MYGFLNRAQDEESEESVCLYKVTEVKLKQNYLFDTK